MFLGGIHFKQFLSTYEEWHALVIGIGEGFCPWASKYPISGALKKQVIKEYHYYRFGMAIGLAGLIFAVAGAVALVVNIVMGAM